MQSKSANFTATVGNYYAIDTTSGNIAVTLPDATTLGEEDSIGFMIVAGSNTVTFTLTGVQTINGTTGRKLTQIWETMVLSVRSSNYVIVNKQGTKVITGRITRTATDVTGTQAITGIGGVPKMISFFGQNDTSTGINCTGVATKDRNSVIYVDGSVSLSALSACIKLQNTTLNGWTATIQSFDSDGFTISWTRGATAGLTISVDYYAEL